MRGSEARRPIPEPRVNENPMEARVAALETDVRNIKDNVAKLFDGMKAANEAITKILTGQAELRGDIDGLRKELKGDIGTLRAEMGTLRAEVKGQLDALEGKIQRWFVVTSVSCAGLAFAAVKLFQ